MPERRNKAKEELEKLHSGKVFKFLQDRNKEATPPEQRDDMLTRPGMDIPAVKRRDVHLPRSK
jgi:hypothetical protein